MSRDPRIDAYIAKAAPFAQPILDTVREWVHAACPQAEETLKWSMPSFMYKGKILVGMAAFKSHAALNFWRGSELTGKTDEIDNAMGQFGRLTSVDDLPGEAEFAELVRQAMALEDAGVKAPSLKKPRETIEMPGDFNAALDANPAARAAYDGFPPSKQRDYLEWVSEAKRPETREKRIEQSVAWLAEGKARHWKYESC